MKHSEILNLKRPATRPSTKPRMLRVRIGEAVAVVTVSVLPTKSCAQAQPPDSVVAFVRAWIGGRTTFPRCPCASTDLFRAYRQWSSRNNELAPLAAHQFLQHVGALDRWDNKPRHVYAARGSTATRTVRMVIPAAGALARSHRKGARSQTRWLTNSLHTFRAAIGETKA